jgi:hypothetical protein
MLNGLIYLSRTKEPCNKSDIDVLASTSSEMNQKHGITGYLYYTNQQIMQYIEGEELELEQLMSNIRNDPRHTVSTEMLHQNITERHFPSWRMKALDNTANHYDQIESILMDKLSILNKLHQSKSNLQPDIALLISTLSTLVNTNR